MSECSAARCAIFRLRKSAASTQTPGRQCNPVASGSYVGKAGRVTKSRPLLRRCTAMAALLFALAAVLVTPASANDRYDVYGKRGNVWLGTFSDAALTYVTSDYCNASETAAYDAVRNSTAGTSEFSGRWPSGLRMSRYRCYASGGAQVDNNTDVVIRYSDFCQTHSCGTFGGENHSTLATSSYCSAWGASYPCGSHVSNVHINLNKYNQTSSSGRQRLLMHETGHSQGLAHHCTSNSIMNQGTSSCNGGAWMNVMSYLPTDRSGIRGIYPYWRYN